MGFATGDSNLVLPDGRVVAVTLGNPKLTATGDVYRILAVLEPDCSTWTLAKVREQGVQPILHTDASGRYLLVPDSDGLHWFDLQTGANGLITHDRYLVRSGSAEFTLHAAIRDNGGMAERDRPWLIRTYSGHSSARASNELYRTNLAKGQTGLSVAFDLPTQTGYDPDDRSGRGRGRQGRRARSPTSARCARCSTASRSAR